MVVVMMVMVMVMVMMMSFVDRLGRGGWMRMTCDRTCPTMTTAVMMMMMRMMMMTMLMPKPNENRYKNQHQKHRLYPSFGCACALPHTPATTTCAAAPSPAGCHHQTVVSAAGEMQPRDRRRT